MNGPSSAQGFAARTTVAPGSVGDRAIVAGPARNAARWLTYGGVAGLARGATILSKLAATAATYLVERATHPLAAVHALRDGTGYLEVAL